jgi:hypothetical protein
MIIRILADNQYRVEDTHLLEIDTLDDAVVAALKNEDAPGFAAALARLVEFVHQHGALLPDDELVPSDAILPASDMTLAETRLLLEQAELSMPTE